MWRGLGSMNKGPNATIRLVRRQNHAGTTVSWTTVQREKNSHAYKLSSNVQTACSTDSLNNCPKHSILRFSSFALKIYLLLKMCQHNLPCSIVLPTACFPEGPSPHFTLCSFWRRRPRLEAVQLNEMCCAGIINMFGKMKPNRGQSIVKIVLHSVILLRFCFYASRGNHWFP